MMKRFVSERVWSNLATISVLGMLVVLVFVVYKQASLTRDGKKAHDAICAFKGDLTRRIQASRDFLAHHPNGIDGISARDISISIANEQLTVTALSPVRCTAEERKPTTSTH